MVLTPSGSRNRDLQSDRRAANQIARVSGLRPIRAAHATKTRPASGIDKAVMENVVQIPRLACSGDINSAISYAFKMLGYDRPTLEQERAIREFVSGRDIFVISPTGNGKSLCFVALPLVFDHIRRRVSRNVPEIWTLRLTKNHSMRYWSAYPDSSSTSPCRSICRHRRSLMTFMASYR